MAENDDEQDQTEDEQPPQGDEQPEGEEQPEEQPDKGDTTDWKAEARKHEKRAKDNKAAADKAAAETAAEKERVQRILKAAGIGDEEDPAAAAERTATERDEAVTRAEKAEQYAKALERERTAEHAARKAGADVDLLMDSRTVTKALDELDDDATDDDIDRLIADALERNPRLKAPSTTPQPPPSTDHTGSGEPSTGGGSIDDIREARRKRRGT